MTPYPFKTQPYEHQKKALKRALRLKRCALLMEPRTGKTKVSIDYLSALALAGKLDRAVIVAPSRVLDVWVREFHVHCPINYHLHIWDADARSSLTLPKASPAYDLNVILVNYEAFSVSGPATKSGRRSKSKGRFKNRQLIEKWLEGKPAAMILDESHKIKSPSGRAATMIVSMRSWFDYRLILTGTPVTKANRVFDLYMQWKFLNPTRFADFDDLSDFKEYFGLWERKNGYPRLVKVRHIPELNALIRKDAYRVTRDECFDLPAKTVNEVRFSLSNKTGAVYDELVAKMIARIEHMKETHTVEASIPIVLTLRLLQVTGGFATTPPPDKQVIPVGDDKIKLLEGYIDEAIENEERIVVCARFRAELDAICEMVRRKGVPCFEIRGKQKREETTRNIENFRKSSGCAVVAMNPQAGGVGIDLSTASHMIWYSLTPSWVDYTQACDRIALSKKATTYTYLLARGTVDTLLYRTLHDDGDIAAAILANPHQLERK
ncbi:DNA helicase [Gordonia phage SummitAcademy]|nr:DNA helicase [Gordonia phage SummitAcademy]WNN94190.1 helicase [Gordonia phage Elinal]